MEIQWSLVLFTALTGMGGCMFACVAADEFLGRAKAAAFPAALVSLIIAVVGGLASVTHLSHPDRIMGALSHPTSGIFTEALLVGCLCVCVVVYLVLLKREAGAGARKAVAVIGAITLLLGGIYLIATKVISPVIPVTYLATVAVLSAVSGHDPIVQLLSGGAAPVAQRAMEGQPIGGGGGSIQPQRQTAVRVTDERLPAFRLSVPAEGDPMEGVPQIQLPAVVGGFPGGGGDAQLAHRQIICCVGTAEFLLQQPLQALLPDGRQQGHRQERAGGEPGQSEDRKSVV